MEIMNSEAEADRTLRNLTVIANIKQNDKVITMTDTFSISPPTYMRGLSRKWAGEYRDANFQRIQETITSASAYVMQSCHDESSGGDDLKREHMKRKSFRIVEAMKNANSGLHNLLVTYADDIATCVRIQLLQQTIRDFIDFLPESVRCQIPEQYDGSVSYDAP